MYRRATESYVLRIAPRILSDAFRGGRWVGWGGVGESGTRQPLEGRSGEKLIASESARDARKNASDAKV